MEEKLDIYKHDKRLALVIKSIENSETISNKNKQIIFRFKDICLAQGLSTGRVEKYLHHFKKIVEWVKKDLNKVTKEDTLKLVGKIEQRPISEWTKHDYKVSIKKLFKIMKGTEEGYPKEVRWIKTSVRNNRKKLPEELLTEEEVMKIIESAEHPRDKALLSLLYETGVRAGELLSLRIRNVEFNDFGGTILVTGKTGMRKVMMVSSVPYLATWLQMHPKRNGSDSPLWVSKGTQKNRTKNIEYNGFAKILEEASKKAGINKRVHPHLFRHSRATFLANHLTEAQMNQYFGWVQGSDMPATYVHLSGRDLHVAIKKIYGIETKEDKKEVKMRPKNCPKCEKINSPTAKFCDRCGGVLDVQTAIEINEQRKKKDEIMLKLLQDPKINKLITKKLLETELGKKVMKIK